jgi:hypothetical protein
MPRRIRNRLHIRSAILLLVGAVLTGGAMLIGHAANAGTVTPTDVAPSVGLPSQNHPVTVSSSGGCCPAGNAVDGKSRTRWASAAGVDPQWIYVDLGQRSVANRVRLEWDASCATAYQVQTSPDATTWTTVFALPGPRPPTPPSSSGTAAIDGAGNESARSNSIAVVTTAA